MNPKGVLSPATLIGFLSVFFCLFLPLAYWCGLNEPSAFDLRQSHYPAGWAFILTSVAASLLFGIPLCWIYASGIVDYVALQLALNGLVLCGYFFIDESATKIFGAERAVFNAVNQTLAVNAAGFFTLLTVLVCCYATFTLRGKPLPALPADPEALDLRLRRWLVPVMIGVIFMTALPMLLTHTIPMLSPDPMAGRLVLEQSDLGRPLYNLASSVLPVLGAGTLILAFRRKGFVAKLFNFQMILFGVAVVIQYLTSNRLPLALTLIVFFSLYTLEVRMPRWLLPLGLILFFVLFLGVGGFSSILRQNRDLLHEGHIVRDSFNEAFLGDNLSDLRDGAWVLGEWDYVPLNGMTYLGGLASVLPSAFFPQKKEWYLGLVGLRIVNWPTDEHFGLRLSFFVESFLNFGLAGVVALGVFLGAYFSYLLRFLHLAAREGRQCLTRNLRLTLLIQLGLTFANSSEGFVFYSILILLFLMWWWIDVPARRKSDAARRAAAVGLPVGGVA